MSYFTTLVSLCCLTIGISGQGLPQRLNFYYSTRVSCMYDRLLTRIVKSDENLLINPEAIKANAINLVGMWRIYEQVGTEIRNDLYYSMDETTCSKRKDGHLYAKAEMFGGSYQTEKEISFFTEPKFGGIKYDSPASGELEFENPILIQSWLFTGTHKWTVYENTSFTGLATCFRPNPDNLNQFGEGITYKLETQTIVGSVREGCVGPDSSRACRYPATFSLLILTILIYMNL